LVALHRVENIKEVYDQLNQFIREQQKKLSDEDKN
jgi:hypothetical protein